MPVRTCHSVRDRWVSEASKETNSVHDILHFHGQAIIEEMPWDHEHQHLVGGRCAAAAFYPLPLVRAILRGIRDTAIFEKKAMEEDKTFMDMVNALSSGNDHSLPEAQLPEIVGPTEEVKRSKIPRTSGGYLSVSYDTWKYMYTDEYTGEILPTALVHAAMIDELDYFNENVWQAESKEKALAYPDSILVRCRWVLANKGDSEEPDVRARLVGCEVNKTGEKVDAFYASTPPLEAKKMLFSQFASERVRAGKKLRLSFVDIRKAYFNGRPTRNIFMQFPKELGLAPNIVGKLVRCAYGCRDAGHIWEECYRAALLSMGFVAGKGSPCCFYHATRNISVVVHGDDFTALGTDDDLDVYEKGLAKHFELKIRGRIGEGCTGPNEIKILNRCLKLTSRGLEYEADPRHIDLLSDAFKLEKANAVGTPGVKEKGHEAFSEKGEDTDNSKIRPAECAEREGKIEIGKICSLTKTMVAFDLSATEILEVIPYSMHYPLHPSKILISKAGMHELKPHMDRFTGKDVSVMKDRHLKLRENSGMQLATNRRHLILEQLCANDKFWICECNEHASINAIITRHCPQSQQVGTLQSDGCKGSSGSESPPESANATEEHLHLKALQLPKDNIVDEDAMTVTVQKDNVHLEAQRLLALHEISIARQVDKIIVLQDVSAKLKGGATKSEPSEPSLIGEDSSLVANGNTVNPHTCVPTVNRQIETTAKLHEVSNQYANQENLAIYKDCDNLYALLLKAPLLVFAARTPPANSNKYKKRLGAKSSKNLEKLESLGHELNPKEATLYRALSARCNYLAQDRCDISYAAKELCREFAIPNKDSYARLKRLVRYLVGLPRLIYRYDCQEMPSHIVVYSDKDFAGTKYTKVN